jgi:hypothetical protein
MHGEEKLLKTMLLLSLDLVPSLSMNERSCGTDIRCGVAQWLARLLAIR